MAKQWDIKRCPSCGEIKTRDEFGVTKAGYLRPECKQCSSARARAYYAANRPKVLARVGAHQKNNPEEHRAAVAKHVAKNPEGHREREARRRASICTTQVEKIDLVVVFERDLGLCGLCLGPVDLADWHLDHIVPLALGGTHTYDNVQVSHPLCNLKKGARL